MTQHSAPPRAGALPDATAPKPRVLCVDDEPLVLAGLARTLRPYCDVRTAVGGRAGIEALAAAPDTAVVISDLRMPELDGATFLACVRRIAPDVVRILLTGQADVASAIAVVNEGQVFRFLLKPIASNFLRSTVEAAVVQYRAFRDERALLEEIVPTSIARLARNLLSAAYPDAYARAQRLADLVGRIGPRLALAHRAPVKTAALLSQMGVLALPPQLRARVCGSGPLTPAEQQAAREVPLLAARMLAGIPRLDSVRYILSHATHADMRPDDAAATAPEPGGDASGVVGARLLRFALAYEEMASAGVPRAAILPALAHDVRDDGSALVLAALQAYAAECDLVDGDAPDHDAPATSDAPGFGVLHPPASDPGMTPASSGLRLSEVSVGMVFTADVCTDAGLVLVARGREVSPALIERIRADWSDIASTIWVHVAALASAPA